MNLSIVDSALIAQFPVWWPIWLTPIWLLAIGLVLGTIAIAVTLAIFAGLSLTPLGTLADVSRTGVTASLVSGVVCCIALLAIYLPMGGDEQGVLVVPLIVTGLIAGFALVYGVWHRTRVELFSILGEGIVPYVLGTAATIAVIGLLATPLVKDPKQIIGSIWQVDLFGDGVKKVIAPLPPAPLEGNPDEAPFQPVPLDYVLANVAELTITTDKTILIADSDNPANISKTPVRINAGDTLKYSRADREDPPLSANPKNVFIQNREIDPATVTMTFVTRPLVPEANSIVTTALMLFGFFFAYIAFRQAAPRIAAVALATAKSEMAQPLYLLLLTIGLGGVALFTIAPFNTLEDDIRMMKDSCVTLLMVLGMFQAVWSAGSSVHEEIEGRTALTVLSKPLSRRSFIMGKYAGIMFCVLVMFVIVGAAMTLSISYKPIFEARETTRTNPEWQVGFEEVVSTVPPLILYFMETMVIGGIAVAFATRLPLVANFVVCGVIYVIGNLTAPLVRSTNGENELVAFVGKLIAVVVPNLNSFNVQAALDADNQIPRPYLAADFNYLLCFVIMIFMVAMLMFEDRDLA